MISSSSIQLTPAAQFASAGASRRLLHQLSSFLSLRHNPRHSRRRHQQSFCVRATNAAQPYDSEARRAHQLIQSTKLRIAIIGFGKFGQFLAKAFIRQGHTVYAHSRSNYRPIADSIDAVFFSDPHDLCEQHPDVVVICTSILSTESVIKSLPLQRLRRDTLFVDVLSVKEFPKNIFLRALPPHFDILCTHPMFGPESGKHTWKNLPFVFDKVRIGDDDLRVARVENFLDIFEKEGCRMVEMRCEEHDKYAAGMQFITHKMGRILEKLQLESTPINTKGYEALLEMVENTAADSFDTYYGIFMYDENAMEQWERIDLAFESLKKELFGVLHEVLISKQLSGKSEEAGIVGPVLLKLPKTESPLLPPGAP